MNILDKNANLIENARGNRDVLFISKGVNYYLLISRYGKVWSNNFSFMLDSRVYETYEGPFDFSTIIDLTSTITFRLYTNNDIDDEVIYLYKEQKFKKYKNSDLPTYLAVEDITKHKWEVF